MEHIEQCRFYIILGDAIDGNIAPLVVNRPKSESCLFQTGLSPFSFF